MIKSLKTKKALRVLATKKVTSVALFNFQSLEEVNEYVKNVKSEFDGDNKQFQSLKKVLATSSDLVTAIIIKKLQTKGKGSGGINTPVKFVKPNMTKLKQAFSVVDKYQDKIDSLDSVINILNLEFRGEKNSDTALSNLKKLRATIKKELDSAYKFLSELANNHEPELVKDLVDAVSKKVQDTFEDQLGGIKHIVYMVPSDKNIVQISHYIELNEFVDDKDFVHDKYYLIINALVDTETSKVKLFINSLQSFAPPGRGGNGIEVDDSRDAVIQALVLLEHAGFSSLVDRTPIPTSQDRLERINWNVPKEWIKKDSVKLVDHDVITVTFTKKVNDKNIQDAMNHFIVDLKTAIIPNNYRMGIKKRPYKSGGVYVVDFIFTLPNADQRKEIRLDAHKVKQLKDMFGLDDKKAGELIKHFNNM